MDGLDSLEAIQVLELADDVAGAFTGSLLAQLGARVLKVESPDGGDPLRRTSAGRGLFAHLNAGKKSVTLKSDIERAALAQLVGSADCVIRSSNSPRFFSVPPAPERRDR